MRSGRANSRLGRWSAATASGGIWVGMRERVGAGENEAGTVLSADPFLPLLVGLGEFVFDFGDAGLGVAEFGGVAVDLFGGARVVEGLELGLERHDALLELLEE